MNRILEGKIVLVAGAGGIGNALAVRYAAAVLRSGRQPVPLHDRDPGVRVGEHPRGQQAGDAAAKDERMLAVRRLHCASIDDTATGVCGQLNSHVDRYATVATRGSTPRASGPQWTVGTRYRQRREPGGLPVLTGLGFGDASGVDHEVRRPGGA